MVNDDRRKLIKLEYANLVQEQEACSNQYSSTIDEAERVRLKRKLDNLDKKVDELERQLYSNDLNADANRRSRALEDKLPKIDFKKQITTVKNILEQFTEDGAALFLINDSLNMAGDLFRLEFKKMLEEETTDLKHYEVAFSIGRRLDEIGFLQGLGGHLGIDEIENEREYSTVIDKIFGFIGNGSIVFIELRKINLLSNREDFFSWLVNNFWKTLVEKLSLICQFKDIEQVKFIFLAMSDTDICKEYAKLSCFCTEIEFDKYKILEIPLKEWSEKDIRDWLTKHSGLSKEKNTAIARDVYESSRGGTPKNIRDALMSTLS
ncbi:MAG: hypothetical protein KME40_22310 [Komarekiella atlantica HA4396-MV6]|jgi:hypothetical protein|nr:hypothetical protein [Komarekiella atlantica HA4396-MV6]